MHAASAKSNNAWHLVNIWLSWTVVNATAFSTCALAVSCVARVAAHFGLNAIPHMVVASLFGIGGVGFAQQVVLRRTALECEWWVFALYLGLLLSFFVAGAAMCPASLLLGSDVGAIVHEVIIIFVFGVTLGGIQSRAFTSDSASQVVWSIASGVGCVGAAFSLAVYFITRDFVTVGDAVTAGDSLVAASLAGGAYGGLSGGGLVWLQVITPPVRETTIEPSAQSGNDRS